MSQKRSVANLSRNVFFSDSDEQDRGISEMKMSHWFVNYIVMTNNGPLTKRKKKSISGKNTRSHVCETQKIYSNWCTTGDRREPLHAGRGWTAPWVTRQRERGRQVEELMNVSGHGEKEAAPQQLLPRLPSVVSAGTHTKARPACPITWTGLATGELLKLC